MPLTWKMPARLPPRVIDYSWLSQENFFCNTQRFINQRVVKFFGCQLSKTFYQKFWGQFEQFEAKEVKSEVNQWTPTDLLTTQYNAELWVMNYWFRNWILKTRSCKFIVNSTFSSQKYFLKVRKGPTFFWCFWPNKRA